MNPKKIASFLVLFSTFGFLCWLIFKNFNSITSYSWNFNLENILPLAIFAFPITFVNALSWHLVTQSLGIKVNFKKNLRIWSLSNISRFIPGGFWQYPSRVYLLKKAGVSKRLGITALIIESLMNLVTGSLIVIFSIPFLGLKAFESSLKSVIVVTIFLLIGLFILSNKRILEQIFDLVRKLTKKEFNLELNNLSMFSIPKMAIFYILQYSLAGISLFFLSRTALFLPFNLIPTFIGIYTASWILGYLTVFAPSGLGVQDISIAAFLSSYMPLPTAAVLVILFRIITIASEVLTVNLILFRIKD